MAQHVWTFIFLKKNGTWVNQFYCHITTDFVPTISIPFWQCPKTFPSKHARSIRRLMTLLPPQRTIHTQDHHVTWIQGHATNDRLLQVQKIADRWLLYSRPKWAPGDPHPTCLSDLWNSLKILFVPTRLCNTAHHPLANSHVKYFTGISKQSSKPFGR